MIFRQVFTDGRELPRTPEPTWLGNSVGRWDGDVFVVETNGLRDGGWIDTGKARPHSDALHVTERFRRVNFGTMQIDVTVEDPKAYTKPFTVRVNHRLMPDTDLIEFVCAENEKSDAHLVGK